MREYVLTGRRAQQLRQILIIRADDFFIDDANQLHCNDQRTHVRHLLPPNATCRWPSAPHSPS